MADLTAKQNRNQNASPPVRPPRAHFSDDQLQSLDAAAAGHQAATEDPTLNGQDAERRYREGTT
jgi:hypothetical protein